LLASLKKHKESIELEETVKIFSQARIEGRKVLLETEAKTICRDYGIPVTNFVLAKSKADASRFAEHMGFPVVLKVVSPQIVHKSDAGGVILDLDSPVEVRSAYAKILKNAKNYNPAAKIVGVVVQEMAPASTEVIVGAIKDPQFGQTLMFGLGGIFVELLKDVAFRIAPITENDALEMMAEVKAYPLLKGYRNSPPADIKAIAEVLLNTSRLVMDYPEIKELDLNPVIAYEKGVKTVDARIILE
jgi:acetyl-CoA synthetase (ADP-forming)